MNEVVELLSNRRSSGHRNYGKNGPVRRACRSIVKVVTVSAIAVVNEEWSPREIAERHDKREKKKEQLEVLWD